MRLLRILSCLLVALFCCFSPFFGTFQIKAFADSFPIQLTAAQTLALYGTSIPALYFNGTSTSYVNFEYWRSSKQIVAEIEHAFETSPFISTYTSQNVFGLDYTYWNNSAQGQTYPGWFSKSSGQVSEKQNFSQMEFLIYRWQGDPSRISVNTNSFQFNLNQSVTLSGIDRIRSFVGFSVDTVTDLSSRHNVSTSNYHSQIDLYASGSSASFYTGTETKINGSFYFGCAYMPVYFPSDIGHNEIIGTPVEPSSYNQFFAPCPHMALLPIDSGVLSSPVDLEKQVVNIRAAQGVVCNQGTSVNPDYTEPYVYIIIACPIVWGEITPPQPLETTPNYSEQIDNIQTGVGDININLESTNDRLDQIIEQLDDIYDNMGVSVDIDTIDIENSISNAASSIVSGIRGLFIPSQTDLINFRLNMQSDFQNHFPAFFTAEDKLHNLYSIFSNSVTPRSKISVPLVQMSIPDVSNNTSADFSFGGFDVELKPNQDKLGILYDSLALIIDFIATLAVLNMLRNKLHRILEGSASE